MTWENDVYYIIMIVPLDNLTILIFLVNKFGNKEKSKKLTTK